MTVPRYSFFLWVYWVVVQNPEETVTQNRDCHGFVTTCRRCRQLVALPDESWIEKVSSNGNAKPLYCVSPQKYPIFEQEAKRSAVLTTTKRRRPEISGSEFDPVQYSRSHSHPILDCHYPFFPLNTNHQSPITQPPNKTFIHTIFIRFIHIRTFQLSAFLFLFYLSRFF